MFFFRNVDYNVLINLDFRKFYNDNCDLSNFVFIIIINDNIV